ncbi:FMN-binding protein [Oceanirhabdus sp. W0125-5]|uniref:FMN-binding protein n=1 Tax=Oceanirhabdus sp. W0125-5 TaxID=2999116 RepID=UPI0022F31E60|nr:FMN-binding protein [Oceanirhabdus sp. W0125-5]WBW97300.1 FMN-binding protein [Oceanirhabdus sp. W0125-5]
MKNIQKYRFGIQILCLILSIVGFFYNFKITMLVIMGLTLLSGVFYCGWICPFGFLQDTFSKLGNILGIKKKKMPASLQRIFVYSRYMIFIIVAFIGLDIIYSIMSYDPRTSFGNMLLGTMPSMGAFSVICLFIIVSLFFDRPFCNYFCYEGGKYGIMGFFRIFTIKRNESKCVNCKKCDNTCPMNIQVSKCTNLSSPQCINCFQCISSCPVKGTLEYGKVNFTKKEKNRYFSMIGVALILMAAFFAYNILNGINPLERKEHSNITNEVLATEPSNSTSQDVESPSSNDEPASNDEIEKTEEAIEISGDAAGIPDGIYTGTGKGFRGPITVEVTVKDQQITSVEVIDHRDDMKWYNRANAVIPDSIVENQSTDIDLVSGATYSSIGIRDGVKDALENAK